MDERYTRLYSLPEQLPQEGTLVEIMAGALLKDNSTGKVLVQMKLRNNSEQTLSSVRVRIHPYDASGAELTRIEGFDYTDLSVGPGEEFGTQIPILLPDVTTYSFNVEILSTTYNNSTKKKSVATDKKQIPIGIIFAAGLLLIAAIILGVRPIARNYSDPFRKVIGVTDIDEMMKIMGEPEKVEGGTGIFYPDMYLRGFSGTLTPVCFKNVGFYSFRTDFSDSENAEELAIECYNKWFDFLSKKYAEEHSEYVYYNSDYKDCVDYVEWETVDGSGWKVYRTSDHRVSAVYTPPYD